jgi:hypothetical protein
MEEISTIPHAKVFVDESTTPYERLIVRTWLPQHPSTDEENRAHLDLGKAIAEEKFARGLHGPTHITWSDPLVKRR